MKKHISMMALIALTGAFETARADAPMETSAFFTSANYLTIGSVEIQEIQEDPAMAWDSSWNEPLDNSGGGSLDESLVVLDQILNYGKKLWAIVEANKPVVDFKTDRADAMPAGIQNWQNLESWKVPQGKVYRAIYKNLFGMTVVDFSFRVLYTHGGNFKGKGRYLTHVTIVPANLAVAWGYDFNAQATIPSILNVGTQEDPVAGMELLMNWTVKTSLKHHQSTMSFFIQGDGQFSLVGEEN